MALYQYHPTRSSAVVRDVIGDYTGYLQTDGYSAYNAAERATHIGCWAHARRKFVDCLPKGIEFDDLDKEIEKLEGSNEAKITYLYKDMPVGTIKAETDAFEGNKTITISAKVDEKAESKSLGSSWLKIFSAVLIICIILVVLIMVILSGRRAKKRRETRQKRRMERRQK